MFATALAAALATSAASAQDYSATLAAAPTEYSGACPTTIKFNGAITARRAGRVQYKFVRSDDAFAPIQTLDFATPGTKPVGIAWTLGGPTLPSYSGWEAIRIVYPASLESNKAGFSIRCASAPAGRGEQPPPPTVIRPQREAPPPAVVRERGQQPPPPTVIRSPGDQPPPPTVFRQAGDPPPPPTVIRQGGEQLPNDLAQAHAQIRRLQGENQRLHDENQRLRAFIKDANAHMARQQRSSPPARVDDRRQSSSPPAPPVPGVSCPGPTGQLDPMCHVPGACNVLPHCRL
jgi:hypothetical protein